MKKCRICNQIKPLEDYHKNKGNKDGLESRCKSCRKIEANKEYRENFFKFSIRLKKSWCKKRGVAFDLDSDYLEKIWTGFCPIFNVKLEIGSRNIDHTLNANLDRIDPKKGYVKGNVMYISGRANRIKYDASVEELRCIADWLENQLESATTIREE